MQGGASKIPGGADWGLVCALPEELGGLAQRASASHTLQGLEVLEVELGQQRLWACVGGVGKVRAAHAAALVLAQGVRRGLFVVGVCGGLRSSLGPGTLVHCERAVQTDLAVRADREVAADPELSSAWRQCVPGESGWFLTADRPVLSLWRRLRLARAFLGPCVADMEPAAIAAVCARAEVPWAALRAVTDRATGAGLASFKLHFKSQAGRAADTIPSLLEHLNAVGDPRTDSPRRV